MQKLEAIGIHAGSVNWNAGAAELFERAIARGEARVSAHGALVVETGQHTGRSPSDKFVVRDAETEPRIWWDNNKPMTSEAFAAINHGFLIR